MKLNWRFWISLIGVATLGAACASSSDSPAVADGGGPDSSLDASPSDSGIVSTRDGDLDVVKDSGPAPDLGPGGDFRAYADSAAAALQGLYNTSTGLFPSTGWWNSANALTALIDYSARTSSSSYVGDIAITYNKNSGSNFLNKYYDDEGWWALAWIDAYDLTKDPRYLTMAKTIFADMAASWDNTCFGGIWWSKDKDYKNAIANELFLEIAVRLHQRTPGDAGGGSFIDWANKEWAWFDQSGMINTDSLVNDGLNACKNNNGTTWTYNQGVLIGGLVQLAKETNAPALLVRAQSIADGVFKKLVDDQHVLRESCEPTCGVDGAQFKGIFMRHLAELASATNEARDRAFIATNADWIKNAASKTDGTAGISWSQSFDSVDGARQASALDALNAAIPYASAQANIALSKPTTANGNCGTDQTPDHAVDGTTTTKWCAGATNGSYWLQVDLGAATSVGRVIIHHAGAGGEKIIWNTRDFKLRTSLDGSSYADFASAVTGSTRSVTIHRAFPAVSARYVRLEITNPQGDTSTVAARIAEIQVFAR